MGDYYIQSINKTFFLSGSLIYHTDNSGSNANKSNGTLINKDFIEEKCFVDMTTLNISHFLTMTNVVSGSIYYLGDKEVM